jgi:light-regulated signal transduction histidine kinase (bacteriophytochrome)
MDHGTPIDHLLAQCDQEPITTPERIQPFGFLLATSADWTIVRVSANLRDFIDVDARRVLGRKLDAVLHPEALHQIRNRMLSLYLTRGTERLFGLPLHDESTLFDVAVHQVDGLYVFEAEPVSSVDQMDAATIVRTGFARLTAQASLDAFHRDAARQIRAMTGFDRVMVYRFTETGAGEVIAESVARGMQSYLGLHYPASDIPRQARALYLRNPFRIIADVAASTVPLLAGESHAAVPLDMSFSVTRAVSPVHIDYLKNMGVAASLSISIVIDGALWGLVACHHRVARLPGFVVRTAAELLGQMYSLALESRLRRAADDEQRRLHEATERMVSSIVGDDALVARAEWLQDAVHEIIACDGTAVSMRGVVTANGVTPAESDIEAIVKRLVELGQTRIYSTGQLSALYPAAAAFPHLGAGMLAIPTSSSARDYLLLFRGEQLKSIAWAGNPDKAATLVDDRISPRKSFAEFIEKVRGRSLPFTEREQRAAESVRAALIEINLRVSEQSEDARKRSTERQEVIIAELNHRVRNVLSLIKGVVGQSRRDTDDMDGYVAALQGRILALARAHDQITRNNWSPAPLQAIFDEEIAAYVPSGEGRFVFQGSPVWLTPECFATLALVIHELVTNSVKYGSLSADGKV